MMENVGETHHPYLLLLFDVSLAQIKTWYESLQWGMQV
jgi:hypothetical protein